MILSRYCLLRYLLALFAQTTAKASTEISPPWIVSFYSCFGLFMVLFILLLLSRSKIINTSEKTEQAFIAFLFLLQIAIFFYSLVFLFKINAPRFIRASEHIVPADQIIRSFKPFCLWLGKKVFLSVLISRIFYAILRRVEMINAYLKFLMKCLFMVILGIAFNFIFREDLIVRGLLNELLMIIWASSMVDGLIDILSPFQSILRILDVNPIWRLRDRGWVLIIYLGFALGVLIYIDGIYGAFLLHVNATISKLLAICYVAMVSRIYCLMCNIDEYIYEGKWGRSLYL